MNDVLGHNSMLKGYTGPGLRYIFGMNHAPATIIAVDPEKIMNLSAYVQKDLTVYANECAS